MKKICALIILFAVTMTFTVMDAEAQLFTIRKRYNSVALSVGATNYFGDIVPEPNFASLRFKSTRPNVGISFTRRFRPRISARAAFHWGRILGDDKLSAAVNEEENLGRFGRNLSFRNDIKELSFVGIVDLFENRQVYQRRPDFVPYIFAGIAVFHHNPKAYYENGSYPGLSPEDDIPTGWYALQPLGTEGQYAEGDYPDPYKKIGISIPFGAGVRYKLDRYWDFSFELGWRKTFTDYLDDASAGYAWKNDILNGGGANPKAAALLSDRSAMSGFDISPDPSGTPYSIVLFPDDYGTPGNPRRGNRSDDDWYITTNLTIHYILSPGVRTPKFR